MLPDILAKYVECFGKLTLPSGATVAPFSGSYRNLIPAGSTIMIDPAVLCEEAGRPVPPQDWAIDYDWIIDYNDATTRAYRSGMKFRLVDNSTFDGRSEMTTSYTSVGDELVPKSPMVMSEAEITLGAAYKIRDYATRAVWFGTNHELLFDAFTSTPIVPEIVLTELAIAGFGNSSTQPAQ